MLVWLLLWFCSAARGGTQFSGTDWPVKRSLIITHLTMRMALPSPPPSHLCRNKRAHVHWLTCFELSLPLPKTMPHQHVHGAATAEIKRFREETPLLLPENPLSWWKEHKHEYPQLSRVAKHFACISGISVSAARVFSITRDIVTAQRSVLKDGHVDQLIFHYKTLKRWHSYKQTEITWNPS